MTIVDPLQNAANWFLAFYNCMPGPIKYLVGLVAILFLTTSVIRLFMRM